MTTDVYNSYRTREDESVSQSSATPEGNKWWVLIAVCIIIGSCSMANTYFENQPDHIIVGACE